MLFNGLADKVYEAERRMTDSVLSKDSEKGLWAYMEGPSRNQILVERSDNMPMDATFIFGHIHKPFQEDVNFRGYPQWVNVYNAGGWVVESVERQPLRGGAVVLIDDNLNALSLRMYNEDNYKVRVEEATHAGQINNPLYDAINTQVNSGQDPWKSFSREAEHAAYIRAQNLRARINSMK